MDELTSVFYAPAEAHRFIGQPGDLLHRRSRRSLMRVLSSRMVEIAHILELNDIRGGGVYSFSYLVLGPIGVVRRRRVDHGRLHPDRLHLDGQRRDQRRRTSSRSAPAAEYALDPRRSSGASPVLNILGIRENARVTFGIFVVAAFVFAEPDRARHPATWTPRAPGVMRRQRRATSSAIVTERGLAHVDPGGHDRRRELRARVLRHRVGDPDGRARARAGATSRRRTRSSRSRSASSRRSSRRWRSRRRSTSRAHEGDLIPHFGDASSATSWFGVVVGLFGSVILIMAVNTAYVASSELLERVGAPLPLRRGCSRPTGAPRSIASTC